MQYSESRFLIVGRGCATPPGAALAELARGSYDALLLKVEHPRELFLIPRVKAASSIPVLAVVPEDDDPLDALAWASGADDVLRGPRDTRLDAELLLRARGPVQEGRERPALDRIFDQARSLLPEFRPLLVEDDPDQALLTTRCLRGLGLRMSLPVRAGPRDAREYLEGLGPYADRTAHPLPTLVIADRDLHGGTGYELLRWIRSHPSLRELVFFMMSTSTRVEDVDLAGELGADHYYPKPLGLLAWMDTLKRLALRWALLFDRARRSRSS